MTSERRQTWLKIGALVVVGLFAFDRLLLTPAVARWKDQSDRIASLTRNVQQGRLLLEREGSIRSRWADMRRTDLAADVAEAENDVLKGVARWARESRLTFTGLNPQWRSHEEGYDTLELRASATGDQGAVGRFLMELEQDPLAVRLESVELSSRDAQGRQLVLNARFSALRIGESGGEGRR
jgi:hypothetical protein